MSIESLASAVDGFLAAGGRVVSFDVFDTLIHRRVAPQFVKDRTARHLRLWSQAQDLPGVDEDDLGRARIEHDLFQQARDRGADPEIRITDICREMLRVVNPSEEPSAELIDWLVGVELEGERLACDANPDMLDFVTGLRDRAEQLVFISDMYLGSSNVGAILEHCGYDGLFDAGFASGDHLEYKVTGRLFTRALNELGVQPVDMLHVGDHLDADVAGAQLVGVRSFHWQPAGLTELKQAQTDEYVRTANNRSEVARALHNGSLRHLPAAQSHEQQYGQHLVGAMFAPFIHDVIERVEEESIGALYFLSRDGFEFLRIHEEARRVLDRPGAHVDSRYLCLSRSPTLKASLHEGLTIKAFVSAKNHLPIASRTLCNTFVLLGFDRAEISSHLHRHGLDPTDHFGDWIFQNPRFHALTNDRELLLEARRIGRRERHLLLDYLAQEGFFEHQRVGLVDIGWGGTIQDQLFDVLQGVSGAPSMYGLYFGANLSLLQRRTPRNWMHHSIIDPYAIGNDMPVGIAAAHSAFGMLEELARAPHGTCRGFVRVDTTIQPVLRSDDERADEAAAEPVLSAIQRGSTEYCGNYFRTAELLGASAEEAKSTARQVLQRVIMEPTPTELEIWRQVSHTNDIGGTVELSEQLLPSSSKVVLRPRKLTHDLHRSQWKFGAVRAMLGGLAMRCYSPIWIVQDAKRRQAFVNRERFSAPFLFDNNSIRRPAHQFEPGRLHVSAPLAAALQRADELADGHRSALEDLTLSTESQVAVLAAIRIANVIPGRYRAGMRPINDGWPQHDMLAKIAGGSRLAPIASRLARLKRRRW